MNENFHHAQPVRVRKHRGVSNMKILVLIVVVAASAALYVKPWERTSTPLGTTDTRSGQLVSTTEESQNILAALSKIYEVPVGDEPVMYTIDDAAVLIAQQAFFAGSQDGDTLFIFPQNMKAVIFSQKRNKVINAGPLSYQGGESVPTTGVTPLDTAAAEDVSTTSSLPPEGQ